MFREGSGLPFEGDSGFAERERFSEEEFPQFAETLQLAEMAGRNALAVGPLVIAGNVAWLVSKIFERRFVEVWTKK